MSANKVYFVLGELSGDALAADVLDGFEKAGISVEALGLAGPKLTEKGVESLFDITDLSEMGITAVARRFPTIYSRVRMTVADIVEKQPDIVVLIDSPEFGYAVAKRVRKKLPDIKIVKYICPSVWAWRPGRAKKMKRYIDHVLTILPFEPAVLKELDGPTATYVGHPLGRLVEGGAKMKPRKPSKPSRIVILPGSRKSEIDRHLPVMQETLELLKSRGHEFELTLPAVEHLALDIKDRVKHWNTPVNVVVGEQAKLDAFEWAETALATSGTVTLELALHGIPFVPIYQLDRVMLRLRHLFTGWTTSLPNLVADQAFVQECMNEFCTPPYVARVLEGLLEEGPRRDTQLSGFETVATAMSQKEPTGLLAARTIADQAGFTKSE